MKSTLALTSAALVAAAHAQEAIYAGTVAKDISDKQWDSVAESPDLYATQSFPGRDVSSAYPGKQQDGWEIKISIKEELESPNESAGKYVVGKALSLSSPDGDDVEFDDSWKLCTHVFAIQSTAESAWGAEFEEDCEGLVAPECVDDLKKQARKKFKNKGGSCESYSITPSCLRDVQDGKGSSTTFDSDNASDLLSSNNTFYRHADGYHQGDDEEHTLLVEAAAAGLAVVNLFGSSENADDESFVEVRCMLPNTVSEGSFDPTPDAASGLSQFAGWAVLTGVAAFQMLL